MKRVILLACVVACASSGSAVSARPSDASVEGIYEFQATIPSYQPGSTYRVAGMITVVGDSMIIESQNCADTDPTGKTIVPTATALTRYCAGALLEFDRRQPSSARWFATVPVPKQRNVCVEYENRPRADNRRCVRSRVETYYAQERRNGVVQVKRIT